VGLVSVCRKTGPNLDSGPFRLLSLISYAFDDSTAYYLALSLFWHKYQWGFRKQVNHLSAEFLFLIYVRCSILKKLINI